jgi:uncharacterized damage-inducible protein DinB
MRSTFRVSERTHQGSVARKNRAGEDDTIKEAMLANLRQFARYNHWANTCLFVAFAKLDESDYKAPRAAFFGSIHGTLNHILVNDLLWVPRLEGHTCAIKALDEELCGRLESLRAAQDADDARLTDLVDGLDDAGLTQVVPYTTIDNTGSLADAAWLMLVNLFDHRGQIHDLLRQTTVAPPPLDLILYVREANG